MHPKSLFPLFFLIVFTPLAHGQMITGVWKGRINRQKVEVKIIQNGDSLTGTSYYYESARNYRRYSIKGFFDQRNSEVVWWDDQLIEEKNGVLGTPGKQALISHADFNCPGGGKMLLNGKAGTEDKPDKGPVDLSKTDRSFFNDEWDFIIDNYLVGGNDPYLIDSVGMIAFQQPIKAPEPAPVVVKKQPDPPVAKTPVVKEKPVPQPKPVPAPVVAVAKPAPPITITDKFQVRKKIMMREIPLAGDSIEMRFYDNAQIDGDSISLFLNGKLVFEHIRLLATPYTIKFAIADLEDSNELVMVAENLGTIPPNTAYMVAENGGRRYEARLESTEGSSASIRLFKEKSPPATSSTQP
jgi:hypothetical protein